MQVSNPSTGAELLPKFHPAANIFPLLGGTEFERLVADIKAHGQREPVWLHRDGRIIDGRNRARACEHLQLELRSQTYIGPDDNLLSFVISLNLHRRHLNESQRAMVAARLANMGQGARTDLPQICGMSQPEAAASFNVSPRSVQTAQRVQEKGSPALVELVDSGRVAVSDAAVVVDLPTNQQDVLIAQVESGEAKKLKVARIKAEVQAQRIAIEEGTAQLPEGVFEVIVVDPPWDYGDGDDFGREHFMSRVVGHYPRMTLEEIAALEIPAADDCIMWLWTTHKFMPDAFPLLDGWGFRHRVILTWVKDRMGIGQTLRSQSEFCIVAVKGRPVLDLTTQTTVLHAPSRQHSRKPDEFYEMVESLCIGRRLDYFSRESRLGWEQFGNDMTKFGGPA